MKKILGELKSTFKPEFLNRIDATIVFQVADSGPGYEIADMLLARVQEPARRAADRARRQTTRPRHFLVEKGFDVANGARPLRRAIQNRIEDPLAEGMLSGRFYPGMKIIAERRRRGHQVDGNHPRASCRRGSAPMRRPLRPSLPKPKGNAAATD